MSVLDVVTLITDVTDFVNRAGKIKGFKQRVLNFYFKRAKKTIFRVYLNKITG